jgi:acid phosphatase family membrane protein YuiD
LTELFRNDMLLCAFSAWFVAQIIKTLIYWRITRIFSLCRMFGMGGMPSAHTAFLVAITTMIALREGMASTAFTLSVAVTAVVIYDALGVRYQTGKQSHVINKILHRMLVEGQPLTEETLQELVGHTPTEVFFGALIGLIMPVFFG